MLKRRTKIVCGIVVGILSLTLWLGVVAYMQGLGWPETSPDFVVSFWDFFGIASVLISAALALLLYVWLTSEAT